MHPAIVHVKLLSLGADNKAKSAKVFGTIKTDTPDPHGTTVFNRELVHSIDVQVGDLIPLKSQKIKIPSGTTDGLTFTLTLNYDDENFQLADGDVYIEFLENNPQTISGEHGAVEVTVTWQPDNLSSDPAASSDQ